MGGKAWTCKITNECPLSRTSQEYSIVSYTLLLSVVEYKTLVMRGDMESAAQVLENVPKEELNGIAKFLEAKGHMQEALELAVDPDYKYENFTAVSMWGLRILRFRLVCLYHR